MTRCRLMSIGLVLTGVALGHDGPVALPPPGSVAEAWNVVEQSRANVDQLLSANLQRDVGGQLANISTALVVLDDGAGTHDLVATLLQLDVDLLRATRGDDAAVKTAVVWDQWTKEVKRLEVKYPAEVVRSEVYVCPMHPDDRHLKIDDKCGKCGMALVRRRLPASGVYQRPGEPTLRMSVECPPLVVGKPADVVVRFAKPDSSPVTWDDLVEVHTKKIHLLVNDRSLADYHHEHPTAVGGARGEYRFSFTPTRPGPYRIWADVVPAATGAQEYVVGEIPADTAPLPVTDRATKLTSTVGGNRYELAFEKPPAAGEAVVGTITVTGPDGKGFAKLEPVMGAFAHIVGFSEDGKTVLHVHPQGKTPASPDDRAGPAFAFKFYSPVAGFFRLYCQVRVGDRDVFVPLGLDVAAGKIPNSIGNNH